ncbi:MAG: iron-sulfur cluster assembly scaffold protein [Pseudomonadota bacterium]
MSKLYTTQLLSLAARLAQFPLDEGLVHRAEARSRTCGSTLMIGVSLTVSGQIERVGMQVSACAIGQSSSALLAISAAERAPHELAATLKQIEAWLADEAPLPQWPGFEALAPAKAHPGRHGALLLPWNAAVSALSTGEVAR